MDIDLKYCYGIGTFRERLELDKRHVAIYASNGVMKSSLAQAFDDIDMRSSKDRLFPKPGHLRSIKDDMGKELDASSILVIKPYRGDKDTVKASQEILASEGLRSEYIEIVRDMQAAKDAILKQLAAASGMKDETEDTLLRDFGHKDAGVDKFFELMGQFTGLDPDEFEHLRGIKYADINTDQVKRMLANEKFKAHHADYMSQCRKILDDSDYLDRRFDHTSAQAAYKQLDKLGFFEVGHKVRLLSSKSGRPKLVDRDQFEAAVNDDLKKIGKEHLSLWQEIDAEASRNQQVRDIRAVALERPRLLAELGKPCELLKNLWRAHLSEMVPEITRTASEHHSNRDRTAKIIKKAEKEWTNWDAVVEKYNKRFAVRLTLSVTNRPHALLGTRTPVLNYTFHDHDGATAFIDRDKIPSILSEGENRAFYMLNALFEIEGRVRRKKETVIVVDDIVDSFDYKNKHAIIQYLKELSDKHDFFHLVILTHNFDFFRTVCRRRIVKYDRCYYVGKSGGDVHLVPATSIFDPLDDLLKHADVDRKFIAAIPFARNIIGHTLGTNDNRYANLSSVLHCKARTDMITAREVQDILAETFPKSAKLKSKPLFGPNEKIRKTIEAEARNAADTARNDPDRLDLEAKLVLAIYIRVAAECFMLRRLGEARSDTAADSTYALAERYRKKFSHSSDNAPAFDVIDRVVLIAPEIIHINAFMYEPILDMSADSLVRLYDDVLALDKEASGA